MKVLADNLKLEYESHMDKSSKSDQVVCQFSSIGSLGNSESAWLCKEFLASLSSFKESEKVKTLKSSKPILVIYSVFEVRSVIKSIG